MVDVKRQHRRQRLVISVGATVAVGVLSSPAAATVYEIGSDGSVQVERSGVLAPSDIDPVSPNAATMAEAAPEVPAAAITAPGEPDVPEGFRQPLLNAATRYDVSPRLLAALTRQESKWHATAVSRKGAIGLTQLMPGTARALAIDPRDPSANLAGGARYLRQLIDQFDGNIERALAAYNAGPGRVARTAGLPAIAETRSYVSNIVDRLGSAALSERRP